MLQSPSTRTTSLIFTGKADLVSSPLATGGCEIGHDIPPEHERIKAMYYDTAGNFDYDRAIADGYRGRMTRKMFGQDLDYRTMTRATRKHEDAVGAGYGATLG